MLYYVFLFYTIFPLYESSCIYYNIKIKDSKQNHKARYKHKYYKEIRNKGNSSENYNDSERYFYNVYKINEIITILFSNKGFNYLLLFNLFYLLFLFSICRLSIMDPGHFEKGYVDVYNLKKNSENYYRYCQNFNRKEENVNMTNKNNIVQENKNNILLENFKLYLSSKLKEIDRIQKEEEKGI